ncbi:hypothetical protein R70723_17320 [Paenibacillus sp. FSL R7-0273]|uniref:hybrid sensor histidine kinase/response regulator n=1 Tax=Paenibacillus sp. FSL R7-0273 TaxID=1536772 RepID=UPI0004F8CEC6|nr:ATP-binding protein [Paenibacillus sp. FSL R7-0273]AIQ47449.1 hypothetical protein R70723_17320 [Paenibacillus sp. FSL R7-0273]OMF95989.1 hypothetical protein BK144_05265 [Paenibacillus sp. FSL R7-0273]
MPKIKSTFPYYLKAAAIFVLFLTLLLCCRWGWSLINSTPNAPLVEQGILDLRSWDIQQSHSIPLEGEWEFYPGQLLSYSGYTGPAPGYIMVPGDWGSSLMADNNTPSFGYGTYRLRILVDPQAESDYGFWIQRIQSSSEIEINGKLAAVFGTIAAEAELFRPSTRSYTASYNGGSAGQIELLVRAANYSHPLSGGIVKNIRFGSHEAVEKERSLSIGLQLVTSMILLLHILYAGTLYFFKRNEKALPVFILLLAAVSLSIVSGHDSLLLQWLPLDDNWALKVKALAYLFIPFLMLLLIRQLTELKDRPKAFLILTYGVSLTALMLLLAPPVLMYHGLTAGFFIVLYLVPFLWLFGITASLVMRGYKHSFVLLFTAAAVFSGLIWGWIHISRKDSGIYYPFDLIMALIGFTSFWFKKYFQNAKDNADLYRKLSESDKRKDEFLANTAHELRTPLHGIINLAQSVFNSESRSEQQQLQKNMEQLILTSRRMSFIVNSLLDLSRIRDHRLVLHQRPLSIHTAVAGVADMMQFLMKDKPISLSITVPEGLPFVLADEKRMVQILFNLLRGAVTFTEKGTISITARNTEQHILVEIRFTGQTIAAAELDRMDSVYEIDGEDGAGTGLGLTISRHLVEMHGGIFQISFIPGEGSIFSFTIPAAGSFPDMPVDLNDPDIQDTAYSPVTVQENTGGSSPQNHERLLHERKLNIIAVDDDPVNLKVLGSILPSGQFHVTMAGSGLEALELLTNSPVDWDLLVADVMMPHMTGYELTRRVRERYSHSELPILLLTARDQIEDVYAGFSAGANDYVAKPANAIELQYRVWALATLKRSVHERLRIEAAYLQARIRPEFIISTLNAITALSVTDIEQMRDLSEAFTTYLRISFNTVNSDQWVSLQDELELIRAYLHVENALLPEPIAITWEVEAEIGRSVPPLILQPFVENAVNHGFSGRRGQKLLIRIVDQPVSTLFQVKDNGTGMEEVQIRELLDPSRPSGVAAGLSNTNRRLLQRYGRGLTITSVAGEGTSVSFEIPH